MEPIWRVRLLGGLQADSEDQSVTRFRTRRVGLLLAYLAFYQNRSHSREELADMLWPDVDPAHAKRHLRQALSSLRHHLEPPNVPPGAILDAKQSMVSLNPDLLTTDVAEFSRWVRERQSVGQLEKAVELYRGDLLPGYYEDWVTRERLILEDQYVSALRDCVKECESSGRLDDAIRFVRIALDRDSLREDLHTHLIKLYLAIGRVQSAERQLEKWRRISLETFHTPPNPELRRAIEAAKAAPNRQSRSSEPAPPAEEEKTRDRPLAVVKIPVQLTRFFGRSQELETAYRSIVERETRLLTLVGPAGTGKSRMSAEIGRLVSEQNGWNVWFVPLADISDGSDLVDATLATMKIENRDGDLLDILADRLSQGENLVILDNLEHILDAAADSIALILRRVPNVTLLTSSRQSTKLEGEQEMDLSTLPTPASDLDEGANLAELSNVPSVQLFVDRARAVLPDFQLTGRNARAISQICERLDGLPLAIEIAANLSNAFTPAQLLQNLESRLDILRSRRRDMNSRHRSLRVAIDYSYNLLTPELQQFFINLSVFRGGFSIEAAESICLTSPEESRQRGSSGLRMVLDLQERSLLHSEEAKPGSSARFRLLETYREYAQELLAPEEGRKLRDRHAAYFADQSVRRVIQPEDRDNRNAAVRHLFETHQIHECIDLLRSYENFSVVEREVVQNIAKPDEFKRLEPADQVRLLLVQSNSLIHRGDFEEALRVSLHAERIVEENGLAAELHALHRRLSQVYAYLGRRQESIERSRIGLAAALDAGELDSVFVAYINLGGNHWALGEFQKAQADFQGAVEASKQLFNGEVHWTVLYNYALVKLDLGLLDEGFQQANEGLRKAQAKDEALGISLCLFLISRYYLYKGNLAAALATHYESLIKRRPIGFLYWTYQAIFFHGWLLLEAGQARSAAVLIAASRGSARMEERETKLRVEELRRELPPIEFERAWAEGLAMSLDQAFQFAVQFK